jgi:hypothetical protein
MDKFCPKCFYRLPWWVLGLCLMFLCCLAKEWDDAGKPIIRANYSLPPPEVRFPNEVGTRNLKVAKVNPTPGDTVLHKANVGRECHVRAICRSQKSTLKTPNALREIPKECSLLLVSILRVSNFVANCRSRHLNCIGGKFKLLRHHRRTKAWEARRGCGRSCVEIEMII